MSPHLYPSQSARRPRCGIIRLPLDHRAFFLQVVPNFVFLSNCSAGSCCMTILLLSGSHPMYFALFLLSTLLSCTALSFYWHVDCRYLCRQSCCFTLRASLLMFSPFLLPPARGSFLDPTFPHHLLQTRFLGRAVAVFHIRFRRRYNPNPSPLTPRAWGCLSGGWRETSRSGLQPRDPTRHRPTRPRLMG